MTYEIIALVAILATFVSEILVAAVFRRDYETLEIQIENLYDELEELQFRMDELKCQSEPITDIEEWD